jgi:plastocyanin
MLAALLLTPALVTGIVDVSIVNRQFVPSAVHVEPGDTVRWTQMDNATHSSNGNGDETWYSGGLTVNKTYQRVFLNAGTFVYRCTYHSSMTGEVTVGMGGATSVYRSPQEMPGVEEVATPAGVVRDLRGRGVDTRKVTMPTFRSRKK